MSQITSPIILDTTGQDIVDAIESLSNRANDIENFTSRDVADGSATAWTSVTPLASGEVHSSIFAKISQMFKNIRYLYKILGTTNISSIGGGTVTGAISTLNSNLNFSIATTASGTGIENYITAIANAIANQIGISVNKSFNGCVFISGVDAFSCVGTIRSNVIRMMAVAGNGSIYGIARFSADNITYKEFVAK